MTKIYVMKNHRELLELWQNQGAKGLTVLHVDFHDDLRGFVIDRQKHKAYPKGLLKTCNEPPDNGNFLVHAIKQGIVRNIQWVHGSIGGRAYDSGIVKYTEDLSAYPHRFAHFIRRDREYTITFKEVVFEDWAGCCDDHLLDIDWDFFAGLELDPTGIRSRFECFVERVGKFASTAIYFCYSPDYVHPSKSEFLYALNRLAQLYKGEIVWRTPDFPESLPSVRPAKPPLSLRKQIIGFLRKKNLF